MQYLTEWLNERTCSVLYATLENSIHSVIYAASYCLVICNKYCMLYYCLFAPVCTGVHTVRTVCTGVHTIFTPPY